MGIEILRHLPKFLISKKCEENSTFKHEANTEINRVFIIDIFLLKNKNRKTDCLEQNGTEIMETSWKETN